MSIKILFLIPYALKESPSQRFRFEQYFEILGQKSYQVSVQSFLNSHNGQLFFTSGGGALKSWALLSGFAKRAWAITKAPWFDYIFIHREVAPIGPPFFEWILARILMKKIIYDFDDAIWHTDRASEAWFIRVTKWRSKVKFICRWSYKITCGNHYLASYAKKYNNQVVVIPTTIDTVEWHNPDLYPLRLANEEKLIIGWTGSHSTLKYLEQVAPVLLRLNREFPHIQIMIIADRKPDLGINSMLFIPWNKQTEVEDLMKIDIGIMPLPDNEWTKGKCGFKALQYMALKKPVVASGVGVNTTIIEDGKNGFLCNSEDMWEKKLTTLINDRFLREEMGEQGRKTVVERYSVNSNSDVFLSVFA